MSKKPLLLAAVALLAVAGCARKTADLPPQPTSSTTPQTATAPTDSGSVGTAPVGSSNVPGSLADFMATAGTDRVRFDYDSYDLDDEARSVLGRQAEWLARYGQVRVTLEGHADERGTREYNLALGERRANAAKNFLAAQGVPASRINVISYGKERPEAEGSDEGALAINRRAVTVVVGAAG